MGKLIELKGKVAEGYRVASGEAENNPYPGGTIQLQTPFFKALGLDISSYYSATLNVSIKPYRFKIVKPVFNFRKVKWNAGIPPEDFSFCHCVVSFKKLRYKGLVYYPHPETKVKHFQDENVLEILTYHIPGLSYGVTLRLEADSDEILFIK